ncbi:MAG: homocysteine S-methyltransferase family protein [Candidatus Levybacteria bacterium]|nr:homocysteine S-methyltransferase family protein [Candidatus Levybacteria bacterium]
MSKIQKNINKLGLLERLEKGPVLCAEGYLFELERRGYLKAGAFVPEVVLDYPDAVRELHREFLRCGSDVMEAFTYYAHREKLRTIGREDELEPMNRQALRIAREVAAEGNALGAGNICNTWVYDPENKEESGKAVRAMYEEQVRWAVEEGADFIIAETISYLGEALIALEVIKAFKLPAVIMFATTRSLTQSKDGYEWIEACKVLEAAGADVVGFNCQAGPDTLMPLLKKLRKAVKCYTAALPVPYHTTKEHFAMWNLQYKNKNAFPTALDPLLCTRDEMASFAKDAKELGINFIGICCGAGPHHVRAMAEALGRTVPASKYSPDMSQHGHYGSKKVVKKHEDTIIVGKKRKVVKDR